MWLMDEWQQLDDWVAERKPSVIVPSLPELPAVELGHAAKS